MRQFYFFFRCSRRIPLPSVPGEAGGDQGYRGDGDQSGHHGDCARVDGRGYIMKEQVRHRDSHADEEADPDCKKDDQHQQFNSHLNILRIHWLF